MHPSLLGRASSTQGSAHGPHDFQVGDLLRPPCRSHFVDAFLGAGPDASGTNIA
jgi:hypothetical protein